MRWEFVLAEVTGALLAPASVVVAPVQLVAWRAAAYPAEA